jgi:two-component system LytT family response regulator
MFLSLYLKTIDMISAVIIDDEVSNANYLKGLLESYFPDVSVEGIAVSVNQGISLIEKARPALVFLDIELQTATGFDLLNNLKEINFHVIFTTAHAHYAIKAIKFAALDFLLKPIDKEELGFAIEKANKQQNRSFLEKGMEVLIGNMKKEPAQQKIAISTTTGLHVFEIKDIVYLMSEGSYTTIYSLNAKKIMSSRHLKEYEDLLVDYGFFRVHKSYVIDISKIKQYSKSEGGYLIMVDGSRVDVSQKKKDELLSRLSSKVIFL